MEVYVRSNLFLTTPEAENWRQAQTANEGGTRTMGIKGGTIWRARQGPPDQRASRHPKERRSTCKQHAGVERGGREEGVDDAKQSKTGGKVC